MTGDDQDEPPTDRPPPRRSTPSGSRLPTLSPRQLECLIRIATGETSAQIAAALGLSKRTIDEHVQQACKKLGVKRRPEAVAKGISLGLIPPVESP